LIAVDTNVLVRLLIEDNAAQHRASRKLFAAEQIHIPNTVLLETEWVLRDVFELQPREVCSALRSVCGLQNVVLADGQIVALAIDWHEAGLGFADALHLATCEGDLAFRTFDNDLIKRGKTTKRRVEAV
jgi:predicted nucleic-acid-binding protein